MADTEHTQEETYPGGDSAPASNALEIPLKAKLRLSGPNASRLYEMMLQKPFQMELEILGPGADQNGTVLLCNVEPARVSPGQVTDIKEYLLKGYKMGLKKKPDKDGWVHISLLGHMLGALNPRGSVKAFGYKRLQDLVAASRIFELSMLGPNMACRPLLDLQSSGSSPSGESPSVLPAPEATPQKLPPEIARGTIVALKREYGLAKCETLGEEIYFKPENLKGETMDQLKNGAKVEIEFVRDHGRIKLISLSSVKM